MNNSKKLRIAFLSTFTFKTSVGGVENCIYFLSQELMNLGHQVDIIQPIDAEIPKVPEEVVDGRRIRYIPLRTHKIIKFLNKYNGGKFLGLLTAFFNKAKFILYRKQIAEFVLSGDYDLVHQHDFIANIFSTKIIAKKIKCVLTNHTGEFLILRKLPLGKSLLKKLLCHYSLVIGPSSELTPIGIVERYLTLYNGVNLDLFHNHYDKRQIRAKLGYGENDFICFCPRRWAPTKGVIYLVEAIRKAKFDSRIVFVFAGSGYAGFPRYRKRVNDVLKKITNKTKIILLDDIPVRLMPQYYMLADVTIIPSLLEAVSLSALESMACGVPVISTNVGGMKEIIRNKINGILVQAKDSDGLVDAINEVFDDSNLYARMVSQSIAFAAECSWKKVAERTLSEYCTIINS